MSDTINVEMPQLGETVTEGTVTRWLKSVGESVVRDEPLFEISTDKVDSEVPSPASGILTQILVQEGETVFVGTQLAIISVDGAGQAAPPTDPSAEQAPPSATSPDAPYPEAQVEPMATSSATSAPPSYADRTVGRKDNLVAQTPGDSRIDSNNASTALGGMIASPIVRRMIAERGIEPSDISPTGPGGRITREDILSYQLPRGRGTRQPQAVRETRQPQREKAVTTPLAESDEIIPFDNIRRRTAEHMVMSKATSPHTLISLEADYEAVEQVRRLYGERFRAEEGYTLSYLPFAARAAVEALKQWPRLNASVVGDSLVIHHKINLGIAVDINHEGLIVPVVHRADDLTLRGTARRIHDLATRARTRRLTADDISGGTFSITNAGPYGTLMTVAIINQPQVAILSTDGVKRKPVVATDSFGAESIAIHSVGVLAMSFDHRAIDGAYVAAFLSTMSSILATHDFAAEL